MPRPKNLEKNDAVDTGSVETDGVDAEVSDLSYIEHQEVTALNVALVHNPTDVHAGIRIDKLTPTPLTGATISEHIDRYIAPYEFGTTLNVKCNFSSSTPIFELSIAGIPALDLSKVLPFNTVGRLAPDETRIFESWSDYWTAYLYPELEYVTSGKKIRLVVNGETANV
jgi:hypothetical protein